MANRELPAELVSLIHHTELNKAGWWDKTIQQLILSILWLSGEPLSVYRLIENLKSVLHIDIDPVRVTTQAEKMVVAGTLTPLSGGALKIVEAARRKLEDDIRETEELNARVRIRFADCMAECCPGLRSEAEHEWERFNSQFIQPVVQEIGARTYQLISGTQLDLEKISHLPVYLANFSMEHRQNVRSALVKFLDPRSADVRSFILLNLNAHFSVEAGNLAPETVDSLVRMVGRPPTFKIFVDTNFLFSFLELHENPSNEAAKSLVALTKQLEGKAVCKFYVSPETLDEFKRVVRAQKDFLGGLRLPPNLAAVALEIDLSGVARKFIEFSATAGHSVSAESYFEPYLSDLIPTLKSKSVDFFNASMDGYAIRQDVIDDIMAQLETEQRRFGPRARSYDQLRHDIVLWHFVSERRPARVESPVEATCWIVTVDYHFLGFDEFKRRKSGSAIPLCLHPTSLIQMLQFWLPRSEEFEEAILDSLRLPLLFQEFGDSSEKVTVKILETMARFENVAQMPKEMVGSILVNRALRQEIALEPDRQKQVDLIRDAIIEESEKAQSQLRATMEDRDRLAIELDQHRQENATLREQLAAATGPVPVVGPSSAAPTEPQPQLATHAFSFAAIGLLVLALLIALTSIGLILLHPRIGFWRAALVIWSVVLLLWFLVVHHFGKRNAAVTSSGIFGRFVETRNWVFGLIALVVGWDLLESAVRNAWRWFSGVRGHH